MVEFLNILGCISFGILGPKWKIAVLFFRVELVIELARRSKKEFPLIVYFIDQFHGDRMMGQDTKSGLFKGLGKIGRGIRVPIINSEDLHGWKLKDLV